MALTVATETGTRHSPNQMRQLAEFVSKHVPSVWMPYEEKAFARGMSQSEADWTEDYLGTQYGYLDTNFARERFDHIVNVIEYLK